MLKRLFAIILFALLIIGPRGLWASNSLSYSGRLVNADGSPVTNSVNLKFELAYTTPSGVGSALCSQQLTSVQLSNGVFHVKLDPDCSPLSLTTFLAQTPAGESVAIRVTDESAGKTYSYQALSSIPFAQVSKQLSQMGANTNDVLQWDGAQWIPASLGSIAGVGTVTQVDTGTGLTGGPITGTGTISIANSGVNTAQLADGSVTDFKVATGIARTKLANGTPNYVLMNNGSGVISEVAQVPLAQGGTGAANAADARTNLGLGLAAVLNTGMGSTNVLIGGDVQSCLAHQKLQWNLAPVMGWSCVNDNDSLDTTKLPLAGGTMTGAIDMGSNAIVNLPAPTNPTDAANMAYVDAQVGSMNSSQWTTAGSDIYYDGGNVGIGTMTPWSAAGLEISKTNTEAGLTITRHMTNGNGPGIWLRGVRGTEAAPTQSLNLDSLGKITFAGFNELGAFQTAASITARAAGDVTSTSSPSFLTFHTTPVGSAVQTTKMYIGPEGYVGIGTTSPTQKLDVTGNVAVSGTLRLKSDTVNYVELRAPTSLASTLSFIFPGTQGTVGQALITDGAGNLSWSSVATSASTVGGDLNGTITNAQINSSAVGSTEIADLSIVDADIANNTISYGKLNLADASIPQAKVNGLTTALSGKEPTITAGDSTQFWRGDKTWQTLNTTAVPEGTNLYFLESRVRDALMTGYAAGSALSLAPTDSLLQALGKLEGQIIANKAAFDGTGQWSKNGTSVYYNGGNVGIGTTIPSTKFEILGDADQATPLIVSRNSAQNSNMMFKNTEGSIYIGMSGTENFGIGPNIDLGHSSTYLTVLQPSGNVGIGSTTPAQKLHVGNGNIELSGNYGIGSVMGSATSERSLYPSYSGINSMTGLGPIAPYNIGILLKSDEMISFAETDTNAIVGYMDVNAKDFIWDGKVGIGTVAPRAPLEILHATNPSIIVSGDADADTASLKLFEVGTSGAESGFGISFNGVNTSNNLELNSFAAGAATTRMVINRDTGNVGVGTATPERRVDVNGDIRSHRDGAYAVIESRTSSESNYAPHFIARRSRGTLATPTYVLNGDQMGLLTFRNHTGAVGPTVASDATENHSSTTAGANLKFMTVSNGTTTSLERMRVEQNGNVGIGTAAPAAKLDVAGTVKATEMTGPWDQTPNGYIRLGDVQIAWGTTGIIADGANLLVTFPAAFSSPPVVTTTSTYRQEYNCTTGLNGVDSRTATNMRIYIQSGANNKCSWIAIGPWR